MAFSAQNFFKRPLNIKAFCRWQWLWKCMLSFIRGHELFTVWLMRDIMWTLLNIVALASIILRLGFSQEDNSMPCRIYLEVPGVAGKSPGSHSLFLHFFQKGNLPNSCNKQCSIKSSHTHASQVLICVIVFNCEKSFEGGKRQSIKRSKDDSSEVEHGISHCQRRVALQQIQRTFGSSNEA